MILSNHSFNWLDLIPNQWEIDRVKDHFYFSNIQTENFDNYPVLSLTMSGVKKRNMDTNEGQLPESYEKYNLVDPSCLVFNPMDLISGWVDVPKTEGLISPSYRTIKLRSDNTNLHFIKYYFQSLYKEKVLFYFGEGVHYDYRWGLGKETLKNFPIPIPPKEEQNKIVSYLDHKTNQINELIKKIERKIELLKEQRKSLINEVVTKGLNPNVEMKDSGVKWVGKIPSHWETKKIKYLIEDYDGIKIGPFGSSLRLDTLTDEGIKVYGQGNVIKDDFSLGHRHIPIERFDSDFTQYEIFDGDVLVTMMGTTGKSKVFKKEYKRGILDSHLLRLRFKKEIFLSELFVIILQESNYIFNQIKLNSRGSIMEGLNSSIIKEITLLSPPFIEQQEILKNIERETKTIDDFILKEEKRIDLLKEYKQSLISEVVTGKKRVVS